MGLAAPQHVASSGIRDHTGVPCTARWVLNHWTSRKAWGSILKWCHIQKKCVQLQESWNYRPVSGASLRGVAWVVYAVCHMESFFKNLIRRLFLNTMACSKLFTVSPFILISTPTLSGAGRPFSFTLYHKRFPEIKPIHKDTYSLWREKTRKTHRGDNFGSHYFTAISHKFTHDKYLPYFSPHFSWFSHPRATLVLSRHSTLEKSREILPFSESLYIFYPSFLIQQFRNTCPSWSSQFSHSVVPNSLPPHGLQHTRPPCPSPTPRACSNLCPSSR